MITTLIVVSCLLVAAFVASVWYLFSTTDVTNLNKIDTQNKRQAYKTALLGTCKATALLAAREYYSSLRSDGKVTLYDEVAIMNDLNCMKQW